MTRHDTISPNLESFILLAVSDAIEKHVTVFSSNKNIQPLDHSKSDEIEFILVSDFIIAAQGKFDLGTCQPQYLAERGNKFIPVKSCFPDYFKYGRLD